MSAFRVDQWAPLLVLGLVAAGTSWLVRISEPPEARQAVESSTSPDMIVDRFTLQRFDAHGRRQYVFTADEMRHFAAPERTALTAPTLLFLGGDAPIRAQANAGIVSADGDTVRLEGNVLMVRDATPLRASATLQTEAMTIWPETERVAGDQAVRYIESGDELLAGSFQADNMAATLELSGGIVANFTR
ncbi:MAG: LPS export ABC transporter periplasmic protein LptC [Rhodocyclaceae bacterium]|nr:LPS export ABC transporter periplasmic protein LptC [Rhodocyclaceae bacterium]